MTNVEIVVGKIARAHGLRGQLVIQTTSIGSDMLLQVEQVVASLAGNRRTLAVRDARRQGKLLLLAFEGFNDRTAAEALLGSELVLNRSALPPPEPDEFYASSLVGLPVEGRDGARLGTVIELETTATQAWLVVETPTGKHLVPFTEPLVEVRLAEKRIVVDAPPGLLDGTGG